MTVTVTSERAGPQLVTVDGYLGEALGLRGQVTIDVQAQNGAEVPVPLTTVCVLDPASCPPVVPVPCELDEACEDGIFCTGTARCVNGFCASNGDACPTVVDGCLITICFCPLDVLGYRCNHGYVNYMWMETQ